MTISLYAILGLTPSATPEQIKAAGRKLQKALHPDMPGGDPEKFREVTKALTVLRDPRKREQYDTTGNEEPVSEENEEQQMAWALLAMQFSSIVNGEHLLGRTNIPEEMRKGLRADHANGAQQIVDIQKKMARVAEMRRRLKVPEGKTNRLDDVLQGHERKPRAAQANVEKQMRVGKLAEEMLEGYLWTMDPAPAMTEGDRVWLQNMMAPRRPGGFFTNSGF